MSVNLTGSSGLLDDKSVPSSNNAVRLPKYEEIVPKNGVFLGLDISKTSSGISIFDNGVLEWYNATLETPETTPFHEVVRRRELKEYLLEAIAGRPLDLVILEDVYVGEYAKVARTLFSLNTAIDELILDGEVTVKDFHRVQNSTWKRWLRLSDPQKLVSGANDKLLVEALLARLGLETDGKGKQDRLDSAGMVIGYFLNQLKGEGTEPISKKDYLKTLPALTDIACSYESNETGLQTPTGPRAPYYGRVTGDRLRAAVSDQRGTVLISTKRVHLGNITETLGVNPIPYGGYLAFWLKEDFE